MKVITCDFKCKNKCVVILICLNKFRYFILAKLKPLLLFNFFVQTEM